MSAGKHPAEVLADALMRYDCCSDADIDKSADMLRTIPALEAERDRLRAVIAAAGDPYAWAVSGLGRPFYGKDAEADARSEARRCGGTAKAFPLYLDPVAQAAQKPFRYIRVLPDDRGEFVYPADMPEHEKSHIVDRLGDGLIPVYAASRSDTEPRAALQPLTDERRLQLWKDSKFRGSGGQIDWFIEGTRAAEQAHGIGREHER